MRIATSVQEYAREIIRESNRVAEIVRNLLDFSRQSKQEYVDTNIKDIIDQTLSLVSTLLRHDQITLNIKIEDKLPKLKCNSQQIQQVLMNLITNARDALNARYSGYNKNKIINLTCKELIRDSQKWIKIIVEDYGSGIPKSVYRSNI